ncbi:aspartic proteinase CDR1-like [Telopea speciosissima]|uniref:aspartic proteinase CDR1-like n=1 Tax=Telopea speciosissima TaxID=54955 RepID=UPI001CC59245|nr:aspartic proteinase CDR1-like [Telopea speciosissima]
MVTAFRVHALFIFSFTTFISFIFCITSNTAVAKPRSLRFNVELIHRESLLSPFQNPKTILSNKAQRAYESSIARYTYLTSHITSSSIDKFKIDVIPYSSLDYLAKIPLGAPASDIFTTIDTSSGILWIQCKPCLQCFDYTKSTTYTKLSCFCSSSHFKLASNGHCRESPNGCTYHTQYGNQDESFGNPASESLAFINSDGGVEETVMNLVFVCGINDKFIIGDQSAGVLGLAAMNLSIVSQLSSISQPKFSYCFGNLSDPSSKGNLIFGDAHISGFTTPFIFDRFYYLNLIGISIGSERLNIPPGTFDRKDSGSGGVIIDSGTPLTILAKEGYNEVTDELSVYLMKFKCNPVPFAKSNRLCSSGNFIRDLNGFPTVTFHFKDNAKLVLGKWSLFTQVEEDVFCLAFLPSDSTDVSVIGNMAQQFYNFGFDLVKNELSFIHSHCII